MPLLRFDLVEGRSPGELKALLDAAHGAVVTAFGVPERDRYQIVSEHAMSHFIVQDTGLGIERTRNCVVVQVISRPRSKHDKVLFYKVLSERLERACDIKPSDLVVSIVTNTDEDWSFGGGRAQFLTGEL
jgi:hypothetical protein